jgi:hypothetical protein
MQNLDLKKNDTGVKQGRGLFEGGNQLDGGG